MKSTSLIFSLLLFFRSIPLAAQAMENASNELEFRGQGLSPWCLVFTEEQVLKSALCKSKQECQNNANESKFSIFDLALVHRDHELKKSPSLPKTTVSVFRGYLNDFPYQEMRTQSVRDAKCTLEKAIFYINRSENLNPTRQNLYKQLAEMNLTLSQTPTWQEWYAAMEKSRGYALEILEAPNFKSDTMTKDEAAAAILFLKKSIHGTIRERKLIEESPSLQKTFEILSQLAHSTKDQDDFVGKVLNYSTCDDRVDLPLNLKVQKKLVTQAKEIRDYLEKLLSPPHARSLSVGVCAEVLQNETLGNGKCGSHAVAVKDANKDHYLIIDSAFFSKRPRNRDGSIWIPKNILIMAITKHGLHLKKIKNDLEGGNTVRQNDYKNNYTRIQKDLIIDADKRSKEFIQIVKSAFDQTSEEHIKKVIRDWDLTEYEQSSREEFLQSVNDIKFKKADDLDQLLPIFRKLFSSLSTNLQNLSFNNKVLDAANLIWLE